MSRKDEENDKELQQLISDLEQLKLQVNDITKRIEELKGKPINKDPIKSKQLKVGDKVIVTNNYRNRKGITGNIVRVTPAQVRIRPDNGNNEFQVYKQNVKKR